MLNLYLLKLKVKGFKGYNEGKEFEFGDINKIIGNNGKGKSSIGEAIAWALLGSDIWGNDKMDSKFLNKSSREIEVGLIFSDGVKEYNLKRNRIGNKTTILLNNKTVKQIDLTRLVNKEIFLSTFNPEYFINLPSNDARNMLISILPELKIDDILKEIGEYQKELIKDDILLIHNDPNLYMKNKRSGIRELEKDIIYNEGILSKLNFNDQNETFDNAELIELEKELKQDKYQKSVERYEDILYQKKTLEIELNNVDVKTNYEEISDIKEQRELAQIQSQIAIAEAENFEVPYEYLKNISLLELEVKNLREEYKKKSGPINLNIGDNCPTCKTTIKHSHLEILKEEINDELLKLKERGKEQAKKLEIGLSLIKEKEETYEKIKLAKIKELREKYDNLAERIAEIKESNTRNKEKIIANKTKIKEELINKINGLDKEVEETKQVLEKAKTLQDKINELNIKKEYKETQEKKNKIESEKLQEENIRLNSEILLSQNQIDICKEYTNIKLKILSNHIQRNLRNIKIELQKIVKSTGEVKDSFDIKHLDGREYIILSKSEKIKAGIEITNLIGNLANRNYPLFMDNSESITSYEVPNKRQLIETKVAECDLTFTTMKNDIDIAL